MPNVVPIAQRFIVSAYVPTEETPTHPRAVTQMLVEHIARPMAVDLRSEGFTVGELENIVYGSLVTYKEEGDRTLFLAQFPHPPGPDPAATLFTIAAATAELVGGVWDGTRVEPTTPERDTYTHYGTTYTRTGYHLVDGVWMYQLTRTPAETEEPA